PDDGLVQGLSGLPVPQHCGFALIGDANRVYILRTQSGLLNRLSGSPKLCVQNFLRIVFYPVGARIVLLGFLLRLGQNAAVCCHNKAARAGGSLIKSKYECHAKEAVKAEQTTVYWLCAACGRSQTAC